MSEGWFALGGAALGFVSAFGVEWFRQRADRRTTTDVFQRTTLLELQEVSDAFLQAMTDLLRNTAPGATPGETFDVDAVQDRARDLTRRMRILSSRATERRVEEMTAAVFEAAYAAWAAHTSLTPAYDAWNALNAYIGTLVR
jgi:hypothetical protein